MKDRWKLKQFDEHIKTILDERKTETVINDGTDMKHLITIIRAIQSACKSVKMITKYEHNYVSHHRSIIDAMEFECLNGIDVTYLYPGDFKNDKFEDKFAALSEHINFICRRSELYNKQIDEILSKYRFALLIDYRYLIIITDTVIDFKNLTDTSKYNKLFQFKCD